MVRAPARLSLARDIGALDLPRQRGGGIVIEENAGTATQLPPKQGLEVRATGKKRAMSGGDMVVETGNMKAGVAEMAPLAPHRGRKNEACRAGLHTT